MANNAIKGDVIGVAFDGTGYGSDGNIWGGEFFLGNLAGFRRMAHLDYIPMPGGDATVREPWRMAASYLYRVYGGRFLKRDIDFVKGIDARQWAVLKAMIDKKINSPLTSSAGRLFDAVGSIVLLKKYADSEAQLPIELEKMAIKSCDEAYGFEIKSRAAIQVIDVSKMLKTIVEDLSNGVSRPIISTRFHNTIANLITKTVLNLRKKFLVKKVVLSGGVFQNRYLTGKTVSALQKSGMAVYTNSKVETSDAGIPVGQVAIADARLVCA
jgi:hydrogenase maturation protein HypF